MSRFIKSLIVLIFTMSGAMGNVEDGQHIGTCTAENGAGCAAPDDETSLIQSHLRLHEAPSSRKPKMHVREIFRSFQGAGGKNDVALTQDDEVGGRTIYNLLDENSQSQAHFTVEGDSKTQKLVFHQNAVGMDKPVRTDDIIPPMFLSVTASSMSRYMEFPSNMGYHECNHAVGLHSATSVKLLTNDTKSFSAEVGSKLVVGAVDGVEMGFTADGVKGKMDAEFTESGDASAMLVDGVHKFDVSEADFEEYFKGTKDIPSTFCQGSVLSLEEGRLSLRQKNRAQWWWMVVVPVVTFCFIIAAVNGEVPFFRNEGS